jgi:regulatory protein
VSPYKSDEDRLKKALDSAYRYLARAPRSRLEIERRLREKSHPESIILQVLRQLEDKRYIDDRALAGQWARDRVARRRWGPSRLRAELARKGIPDEWIEEAIRELFDERDEESRAAELIALRLKNRALSGPREYRRWSGFLFRRGYSPDVIRSVLRKLRTNPDPMDD